MRSAESSKASWERAQRSASKVGLVDRERADARAAQVEHRLSRKASSSAVQHSGAVEERFSDRIRFADDAEPIRQQTYRDASSRVPIIIVAPSDEEHPSRTTPPLPGQDLGTPVDAAVKIQKIQRGRATRSTARQRIGVVLHTVRATVRFTHVVQFPQTAAFSTPRYGLVSEIEATRRRIVREEQTSHAERNWHLAQARPTSAPPASLHARAPHPSRAAPPCPA